MRLLALAFGLALFCALPAQANFDVKAKVVCYDDAFKGSTQLDTFKGGDLAIVAACLGVSETHPSVAEHSLVFDSDSRELHVVRNCDSEVVCDLSDQITCASAQDGNFDDYKLNQQCIYELINLVAGSMICKESESWNAATDAFKFKASCRGHFHIEGEPCTLSLSTGKLFEESGICF